MSAGGPGMVLAGAIFFFWSLGLTWAILNLRLIPRLGARTGPPIEAPLVSIIVPARNEERAIEATLGALLAQEYPRLEVILVDDQSADRTGELARRMAAGDARLRVLAGAPPPPGWLGKPWAQHQGAQAARGELLLFVDADITYRPVTLAAAVAFLEREDAGLVTLLPRIEMHGFWERVAMPQLGFTLFALLPVWMANRERWPRLAIGGGTGMLVGRSVYQRAGGHAALRDAVIDDVALARIVRRVAPTVAVRADHLVSVRVYRGLGEITRGFTKNFYFVLGGRLAPAAAILGLTILVHLVPYGWALAATRDLIAGAAPGPVGAAGLAIVGLITLTRLVVFVPLGYGVVNALLAHPLMIAVWLFIGLRSVWAVGVRREVGWRGRSYDARAQRFGG